MGIAIAFLIPITVLIINCLTIVEKFQNIKKNKKSKKAKEIDKKNKAYTQASPTKETTQTYTQITSLKGINFPFSCYPYYNMIKHFVNMKRFSLWFTNITFVILFLLFLFIKDYFSNGIQSLITIVFIVTCIIIILLWIIYFVLRGKNVDKSN